MLMIMTDRGGRPDEREALVADRTVAAGELCFETAAPEPRDSAGHDREFQVPNVTISARERRQARGRESILDYHILSYILSILCYPFLL